MDRNQLIDKLRLEESKRYPDQKDNDIAKAIDALGKNDRYLAASYLESSNLHELASQCVMLGNIRPTNF